ncbi:hypothetical protein JCM17960_23460 [Magnetospira thiophila]
MAHFVRRLWKRFHKTAKPSPEAEAPKPPHWSERLEGFTQTLDDVLDSTPPDLGTAVHVISLSAFREVVGDAWERLAPKVQLMSENLIQKYLDPKDIYQQPAEDMFVLAFPAKTPDSAHFKAREITIDLGNRLMGSHFDPGGGALVHTAEVPTAQAFGPDGEVRLDVLAASVTEVRAREPKPATLKAAMALDLGMFDLGSNVVQARYRPIWDARVARIVGYRCIPIREVEGRKTSDGAFYPANAGVDFLCDLDRDLLDLVARIYAPAEAQRTDVILPIHAMTVLSGGRDRINDCLQGIPGHCTRRHLIFEAVGAGNEILARDVLDVLRPIGGGVLLRLSPSSPDPLVLLRAGADGVGGMWTEGGVRRKLHQSLQDAPHAVAYLWNMPDRKSVAASLQAGISLFEGAGVAPVTLKAPGRTGPLSKAKIILSDGEGES